MLINYHYDSIFRRLNFMYPFQMFVSHKRDKLSKQRQYMHLITCIVGRVCAIQLKYVLYFSTTVYYIVLHVRKFLHREDTQYANEVTSSIKLNILLHD